MSTTRIGTARTPETSGGRAHGAAPRARASRCLLTERLATLLALLALSAASVVAALHPALLAWSPGGLGRGRDATLVLVVLVVAVLATQVMVVLGVRRRGATARVLDLLVPATLGAMFWLTSPSSRVVVLYVATLGLALRILDESDPEEP